VGLCIIQNVPCALLSRREGRGPVLVACWGGGRWRQQLMVS
jgi:hypothetical protein